MEHPFLWTFIAGMFSGSAASNLVRAIIDEYNKRKNKN